MKKNDDFKPDWVSPPGDTIKEILREKKISIARFAFLIGQTETFTKNLIKGDIAIDKELSQKLSKTLGSTSKFWLKRDEQYREDKIRLYGNDD